MPRTTSFFLDWLRVAAALTVFAEHCIYFWDQRYFPEAARAAHAAVIVFFVLSGYVIAFATMREPCSLRSYAVARLSRLYSVLGPALLLTVVLQVAGHAINPGYWQLRSRGYDGFRYLAVALYLQSNWTVFASPLANTPFWSLSYEFWYYALFGAAVLLRPGGRRGVAVGAVLLIAGPDILLLLPCWLAGVGAYRWRERPPGGLAAARVGFALSLAAAVLVGVLMPELPGQLGQPPWWFSNMFLSDWALALGVAATILFFDASRFPTPSQGVENAVRWGAGHTFSLYLFQFPILAFITAVWGLHQPTAGQYVLAVGGTLLAVLALSTFTEAKRPAWRRAFARGWDAWFGPVREGAR